MPRKHHTELKITFKWFYDHPCTNRLYLGRRVRKCNHTFGISKDCKSEDDCPLWQELKEDNNVDTGGEDVPSIVVGRKLPLYTVQNVTKKDVLVGAIHYSDDGDITLCRKRIGSNMWIRTNDYSGIATCKKCRRKYYASVL